MYDIVVLGGGPGGYVAAIRGAQLGARVALVEEGELGGICLNRGCIPSKALLHGAFLYKSIKEAEEFGIRVNSITVDFRQMVQRKNQVVQRLCRGIEGLMKKNRIEVFKGSGDILSSGSVIVNGQVLNTRNIIIAVGSSPVIPPIPGIEKPFVITGEEALDLEQIPESMAIIGGGVIGVEMAVLFGSLGSKVTVLEMAERIVPMMDKQISDEISRLLKKQGICVITGAYVDSIRDGCVNYKKGGESFSVSCGRVLVSAGRRSNGSRLSLDKVGIMHDKGVIHTDSQMRTNVPGIYAIGDVNGKYMLAHTASREGVVAAENIMNRHAGMDYNAIPQCIYTFPEASSVGMTEEEARAKGYNVKVSIFPVGANGRMVAEGYRDGFIKLIAEAGYGQILGVHIVAPNAVELITQCVQAKASELTVDELIDTIYPHPSAGEIILEAASGIKEGTIHL